MRVVGTVVVGESDLARVGWEASEGLSEPLAGWSHGLVAGCGGGCGERGCAGKGEGEHLGIVNGSQKSKVKMQK